VEAINIRYRTPGAQSIAVAAVLPTQRWPSVKPRHLFDASHIILTDLFSHPQRSYLKLYATISIAKMARFNGMTEEEFLANLASMKYKVGTSCRQVHADVSHLAFQLASDDSTL
jgi:RNA polymerase I-associated factor PAF67